MSELQQGIVGIIKRVVKMDSVELTSNLDSDLGIDSLGFIRLVAELETNLEVYFEDDHLELKKFTDVGSLCLYLESLK
ncbi:MAG: acyl carrier protein [Ruminiclostridium sp.]